MHEHADKLSLILFADGHLWLPDFESNPSAEHAFSSLTQGELNRQTICHNTLLVDGRSQRLTGQRLDLLEFTNAPGLERATIGDLHGRLYEGVRQLRTLIVTKDCVLDFFHVRAAIARRRTGLGWGRAAWDLLLRQNRRYGGFVVHLGVLVLALGVAGSNAWSVQTETTLKPGETTELAGYQVRFEGLQGSEESNHFKVTGTFTVSNHKAVVDTLYPAKKFYPQQQSPIAYVDYRLGLIEDVYLVLGDFARDGSHATVKLQVNRMVSWLWIGGLLLSVGTLLCILPDRRRPA